jgi:Uma2 family endonuclease
MQVVLPDTEDSYAIRPTAPMDNDVFYEFCMANSDLRIEREANGEIIIMPPTGGETGFRNGDLMTQLGVWSKADGRGRAFDSNTEFFLPDGSAFAPDASWVSKERLAALSKEDRRRFVPLCPEFIVELTSPTDRLSRVMAKMKAWMANGAELAWLIDADNRVVYVYRPGNEPVRLTGLDAIDGEEPVTGFRLDLTDIWEGLESL